MCSPSTLGTSHVIVPPAAATQGISQRGERQDIIHIEKRTDNRWTFAAILLAYLVATVPLQRRLWAALGAYKTASHWIVAGLVAAAFIALALSTYLTPTASEEVANASKDWLLARRRSMSAFLIAFAAIAPLCVAWGVLDCFANSGDEYAYLFQGAQFASGRLWAEAPPLADAFVPFRTWIIDGKWLSQYPPGWPAVLALSDVMRLPTWSVNALLGAGTVACLLSPLWPFRNRALTLAVTGSYVCAAFYLFNSASFFPHVLTGLLILLVCLTCLRYQRDRRLIFLVLGGALLGIIGLTRYFSLVLLFPALVYWWLVENRVDRLRIAAVWIAAGLPFLACLMVYQYWVTGSPLRDTYSLITTDDVYLSLKPGDVMYGLHLVATRFAELIVWTSPLSVPVYLFCLWTKAKARRIQFYDLIFPSFVVGYVFFADLGGNRYGPRYYFDAFPLMVVTILSAEPRLALPIKHLNWRAFSANALAISAVYCLTALPFAFKNYHAQVLLREEPYRLAAARHLDNAIVVIEESSGRGLWAEDLARNRANLPDPVLYARPGTSISDLRNRFPERSIWRYERSADGSKILQRVAGPVSVPEQRQ
jgi:hypothetical protein